VGVPGFAHRGARRAVSVAAVVVNREALAIERVARVA
jgi:hypothetical protein